MLHNNGVIKMLPIDEFLIIYILPSPASEPLDRYLILYTFN